MAWYNYDVKFRRCASHNLSAKWGERDVQLYLETFQASPNRDAYLKAAPIIFPIPALYLSRGLGMPLPSPTCATTLTKADPALVTFI